MRDGGFGKRFSDDDIDRPKRSVRVGSRFMHHVYTTGEVYDYIDILQCCRPIGACVHVADGNSIARKIYDARDVANGHTYAITPLGEFSAKPSPDEAVRASNEHPRLCQADSTRNDVIQRPVLGDSTRTCTFLPYDPIDVIGVAQNNAKDFV